MSTITPETTVLTTTNWHPHYRRSEELGQEITELCGYIAAQSACMVEKDALLVADCPLVHCAENVRGH